MHTRFRVNKTDGADEWQWLDDENGWQTIPADIIQWGKHAPDGQATLFAIGHLPVCFYLPAGEI